MSLNLISFFYLHIQMWVTNVQLPTKPVMTYIDCWQLVFIYFYLLVNYLTFIFQSALTYQLSTHSFCFLSIGKPKTVLKEGYRG